MHQPIAELSHELKAVEMGLSANRLTPDDIDNLIRHVQYHHFPGTTVTVCAITLANGYAVIGESASATLENFNVQLGQQYAYENARAKIWPLAGYALRNALLSNVYGLSGCSGD